MIELSKKYRTEGNQEVRIYAVDGNELYPVHGAVKYRNGWASAQWTKSGLYDYDDGPSSLDLVEVKPRIQREVWVNVYPGVIGSSVHPEMMAADNAAKFAGKPRIACVKVIIDCEEGEGL